MKTSIQTNEEVQFEKWRDCCSSIDIHILLGHFYESCADDPKAFMNATMALHDVLYLYDKDSLWESDRARGAFSRHFKQLYENPFVKDLIVTPRYR